MLEDMEGGGTNATVHCLPVRLYFQLSDPTRVEPEEDVHNSLITR